MNDEQIKIQYNRIAGRYDDWIGPRQRRQIQDMSAYVTHPIQTPILDIGSGTGLLSRTMNISVIAADISSEMLALNRGARCLASWSALPFSNASFGTVFAVSVLQTNSGTPTLLKLQEMLRVLRAGGSFYITILKTEDLSRIHDELRTLGICELQRYDAADAMLFCGKKREKTNET